ncbi:MAG: NUDIX domain-containing protein [Candidatus Melainabacteria bacterium]|nr:NUDIX domain-containing protein [Candidatus Melainabacteria bacterium]
MTQETQHTSSAGGIVLNKDKKVLVVSQNGNSWSLPKGKIDEGEEKLEAATREIYEESGIKNLKLIKEFKGYERYKIGLDGGEDKSELKKIYMYLFETEEMELNPIDPANPEARWVHKENVAALLTHQKDKEFFLSIINEI